MLVSSLLLFLVGLTVPTACFECWKCADPGIQTWKSYIWEINITASKWQSCANPEVIGCTFGCYEARLTVYAEGTSYLRCCANDKVMRQIKWNGTSLIPERKDELALVQGRMCTAPKCNKQFKEQVDRPWLVEFFTVHTTLIASSCIIGVFSIPFLIFGVRFLYSKVKARNSGYHTPAEDSPMTFYEV